MRRDVVIGTAMLGLCTCTRAEQPVARAAPEPARPAVASTAVPAVTVEPAPPPAPVADDTPPAGSLIDLPVPGHKPAVVALPRPGRRPLVVATHGAGGTPEAECRYWQSLLDHAAFVLCPRGVTMDVYAPPEERTFFYSAHPALEREVRAALSALEARFGDRVDPADAVYAGFSQGATMGALAFSRSPAPFTAAVLIEGGAGEWSRHTAEMWRSHGGRKVVFACGRQSCTDAARRSAALLRSAGVEAKVVDATGAGHTPEGAVKEGVAAALPWVLEGESWRSR